MKEQKNIIIDCDTGIDDSIALMLSIISEDINLLGVSVVAGNTTVENAYYNTKRVFKLLKENDIELFSGSSKPLVKDLIIADETHADDGFGNISKEFDEEYGHIRKDFIKSEENLSKKLVKYFRDKIDNNKKVILVTIGPMTNLALALKEDPNCFENVYRIVSMGGCFKVHGNTSPVAEFNYWVDPEAANYVYHNSPVKVEMVGLDVTRKIVLTEDKVEIIKNKNNKLGRFIEKITNFYINFHLEYENIVGCVINDPLAIAHIIDDNILSGFDSYTEVSETSITRGQSVIDSQNFYKKKPNSVIFTEVDSDRFFNLFYDRIEKYGKKGGELNE